MHLVIRNRFLFVGGLLCGLMFACKGQPPESEARIISVYNKTMAPLKFTDSKWQSELSVQISGAAEKSENQLTVLSEWNEDTLVFFFKVHDIDLRAYQHQKDHPRLYLDDMVEVLIDTQYERDSCWSRTHIIYHVNLLGTKKDDRGSQTCETNPEWDGKAKISHGVIGTLNDTTDVDTGYMVSLFFPWDEIERRPKEGLVMGINFANGDNDGKGRQLYDWVGAWPMRSPQVFGELLLSQKQ
ncbi:MAG: sugar-binding protein [Bacteroidota bacterium]